MSVLSAYIEISTRIVKIETFRTAGQGSGQTQRGIGRRFWQRTVATPGQAYGLLHEVHEWRQLPATFQAQLELMSRVETAPAMLFCAHHLLMQLCGWLAAPNAGITTFTLRQTHDATATQRLRPHS